MFNRCGQYQYIHVEVLLSLCYQLCINRMRGLIIAGMSSKVRRQCLRTEVDCAGRFLVFHLGISQALKQMSVKR